MLVAQPVLAHGIGTRADLPLPVWLAALGGALALTISFLVLAVLWRRPRLRRDAGIPLPRALTRLVDATATRVLLRCATLAALVLVCVVGFVGPPEAGRNLAPWALFVTFWVGLVPASLLFGPMWRVINPLRLVHSAVCALARIDPRRGLRPLPASVGYWPAAAWLAAFGWFELVYPQRAEPVAAAAFVTGYAVLTVVAAVVFGRGWFARGDGFEVYSTLLGTLAPLGRRRRDRALVLRNPLDGMESAPQGPGLLGVLVVLVGVTAYDGLSRTAWWQATMPLGATASTVWLACSILLITLVFLIGTAQRATPGAPAGPGAFAHTLVPIAAGYAIAHYFSLLVFDGQQTFILAGDPFGTGANLLGLAGRTIDYTVLGTETIAVVQVSAIVFGHLVATVGAHDRAVRLLGASAVRHQLPLLTVMVALTMGAIGLAFAA